MNHNQYTFKIKAFIQSKYGITINGEILNNILKEIFDIDGKIINQDKYNLFDNMNRMLYGISFKEIIDIIQKDGNNICNKQEQTLIDKYQNIIEEKDTEISILKETNDELRTNYWNLKQTTNN